MAKRLYHYEIEPGDPDHLEAWHFSNGTIVADSEEVERIEADIASRHSYLLRIFPVDAEDNHGIQTLMADIGRGLETLHGDEVEATKSCAEDAPYLDAYKADEEKGYAAASDDNDEEAEW